MAARQQQAARPAGTDVLVYLGTYTGKESKGIYVSRLDMTTGALSAPQLAAETPSPCYLAIHPTKRLLYAANEVNTFGGKDTGSLSGCAIDRASGLLTPLNQQASAGRGAVHLVVDASRSMRTGDTSRHSARAGSALISSSTNRFSITSGARASVPSPGRQDPHASRNDNRLTVRHGAYRDGRSGARPHTAGR